MLTIIIKKNKGLFLEFGFFFKFRATKSNFNWVQSWGIFTLLCPFHRRWRQKEGWERCRGGSDLFLCICCSGSPSPCSPKRPIPRQGTHPGQGHGRDQMWKCFLSIFTVRLLAPHKYIHSQKKESWLISSEPLYEAHLCDFKWLLNSEFKINFMYNTYHVCLSLCFQSGTHQFVWQSSFTPKMSSAPNGSLTSSPHQALPGKPTWPNNWGVFKEKKVKFGFIRLSESAVLISWLLQVELSGPAAQWPSSPKAGSLEKFSQIVLPWIFLTTFKKSRGYTCFSLSLSVHLSFLPHPFSTYME